MAEVEIGRSRIWPKSNLAEIEIGRSRNWPKSNWPNSKKKIGRSRNWPKSTTTVPAAGARQEPRAAPLQCLRQTTLPRLLWTSVSVELGSRTLRPCPSSVPVGRRTFHQPPPCRSCGGRAADRAIATVIRSCRNMERSRRCLLRHAAPCSPCSDMSTTWARPNGHTKGDGHTYLSLCCCCCCCGCCCLLVVCCVLFFCCALLVVCRVSCVVVVMDEYSQMCLSTLGNPESAMRSLLKKDPTCTAPWRRGTVQPDVQPVPMGFTCVRQPNTRTEDSTLFSNEKRHKVSAFQRLGNGCTQGSTPKRSRTFVFLVSRVLFLPPSPTFLKLGVSPEPRKPTTGG